MEDYISTHTGQQIDNAVSKFDNIAQLSAGKALQTNGQGGTEWQNIKKFNVLTVAPTEANADGVQFVVLSAEPQTRYNGYIYLIV